MKTPEPLFGYDVFEEIKSIQLPYPKDKIIQFWKSETSKLDNTKYNTMDLILDFLNYVSTFEEVNKVK